jgi:peptidylprolyl isomerase
MRSSVRLRSTAALSVAALSALLLAGCSGAGAPEASPTGTVADLCSAAAVSGESSDAVTVEGEQGTEATATFTAPLDVTEIQRTVLDEGTEELSPGDFVQYAYSVFDAESGEKLAAIGYEPGQVLPTQISAESGGELFGCDGPGARIVATAPATDSTPPVVYVLDVLSIVPTAAWGEPQAPAEGFPTVELAEDGAPTITVPDTEAPTATEISTLKKGDGATVAPGDTVLVQYTGVLWSDGTVFDSSWESGAPATFATTQVVPGFAKALEGQTVGSQVLAVIPPADGYGDAEQGAIPANSTLVFVVDILGSATQPAAQ